MASLQSTHLSIGGPLLTLAPVLKIGLYELHRGDDIDPETVARRAQLAEQAGFVRSASSFRYSNGIALINHQNVRYQGRPDCRAGCLPRAHA
jgi:hypothetical protein